MAENERTDESETEKRDEPGEINDPLTRSDVEAPRKPFGEEE